MMVSFSAESSIFVGRNDELAQIESLLSDPACRLLSLVGPGGIGKTRLALEAVQRFPEAYFVALQPLATADFIVSTIADSLGFQFYSGADPKQQLLDYLREKSCLLLLDNFEHLLDGATLLSEMLVAAPVVRMLVTSRERLNLVEEWVLDVGGLAYPTSEADPTLEQYSAVELFVQHARRVKASFRLNKAHRPAVVRICRLVDGMPLGIELAASWVRALSCDAIADEIEYSLDILETPARNVESRHRTMRATFAPTWNRLSGDERAVFMSLSVFRGGFTREAAEEVAGASLRTLSALVDRSLLWVDANGRYDLHELLRQYAAEKLEESGGAAIPQRHHAEYWVKILEETESLLFNAEPSLMAMLGREANNLRVALNWSQKHDAPLNLRLAAGIAPFWWQRGIFEEGSRWLNAAFQAGQDFPSAHRVKPLYMFSGLAWYQGDFPKAENLIRESITLAEQSGDTLWLAFGLSGLALIQLNTGRAAQAYATAERAVALHQTTNDRLGMRNALFVLSEAASSLGDENRAALIRTDLMKPSEGITTGGDMLTWLALLRSGHRTARKQLKTWLFDQVAGQGWVLVETLRSLGTYLFYLGGTSQANTFYRESLSLCYEVDSKPGIVVCLIALAELELSQRHLTRAARLAGIAQLNFTQAEFDVANDIHLQSRDANPQRTSTDYAGLLERLHSQLDPERLDEALLTGAAMTREQALTYALEENDGFADTPPAQATDEGKMTRPSPMSSPHKALSERDIQVLNLMADGLSNGEIADQLVLATSTIKWYVNRIFDRLEATSRTQAVARARTLGLLS